jgi:hypothetical protein
LPYYFDEVVFALSIGLIACGILLLLVSFRKGL